jgi:hypothetical protein
MPPLTKADLDALLDALDDEYSAWTTSDQVIHDFGRVRGHGGGRGRGPGRGGG